MYEDAYQNTQPMRSESNCTEQLFKRLDLNGGSRNAMTN